MVQKHLEQLKQIYELFRALQPQAETCEQPTPLQKQWTGLEAQKTGLSCVEVQLNGEFYASYPLPEFDRS